MIRLSSGETLVGAPSGRGAAPVPCVSGSWHDAPFVGGDASTRSGPGNRWSRGRDGRPALRRRSCAIELGQDGRDRLDRVGRDRVEDELDVGDALARRTRAGRRPWPRARRRAAASARPWRSRPGCRPVPPGSRTRTATVRSTSAGSRPTSRHASSTLVAERRDALGPVAGVGEPGVPRVGVRHRRAAASAARSSRSSAAGRPGAGRAAAARSRGPGRSGRRSRSRPRGGASRMIVNASSKRSIAVVERVAEGAELGLVPAGPEAEDEPAAADLVDRRGLLGEQRRVVEARAGDERPELDPRSSTAAIAASSVHASHGPRGGPVRPAIEQVLADPDRVEPEVLDRPGHVEQLRPADLALDLGQLDADLERDAWRRA